LNDINKNSLHVLCSDGLFECYLLLQPAEDLELMSSECRCRCHLPNWLLHHILVMAPHV